MNFIQENYHVDISHIESLVTKYGMISAAEILSEELDKNIDNTYAAGTLYAHHLRENAMDEKTLLETYASLFNKKVREYMLKHYEELRSMLVHERDYGYKYTSIKDIASNYLFKVKGKPVESIQWMWMRIAVQVAMPQYTWVNKGKWMKVISGSIEEVRETYEILSRREGIHATPTCVNAGFHIPQLESCFVVPMGDSMLSISDVHKIAAMGSKCNGGFGIDVGRIRHSRVANRGNTKGIPGVLKLFNTLVPYADQLGSRPAAINVLAPVWHVDIETFLTMRDMKAPKDIQCTNLNYTVSIPDLFYKRCIADVSKSDDPVLNRGQWSLFCPRETQILWAKLHGKDVEDSKQVDECPCLHDLWGEEFEKFYIQCEQAGIARKVMKARDLESSIMTMRASIGEPFIFNVDNVNRKSNHQHLGTITQSNLCVHGDTPILTDEGYIPIRDTVGRDVNVWNGEEWSKVTPAQTGTNQQLLTVEFSNGSILKCTPYHKFYVQEGYGKKAKVKILEAQELAVGAKLIKCEFPVVTKFSDEQEMLFGKSGYAYTHGLFCGDGTYANGRPQIALYDVKEELEKYLVKRSDSYRNDSVQKRLVCLLPTDLPPKFMVPLQSSVSTKLDWLAGYADADGCIVNVKSGGRNYASLQIASINREFLEQVKLLLQTLGCNPKYSKHGEARMQMMPKNDGSGEYAEYQCKESWRLVISTKDLITLTNLGFKTNRLQIDLPSLSQNDTSRFITVTSVCGQEEIADTFCFSEPKRHMGIFGGVITGQCMEITQYTKPGDVCATCDLATINLASFVKGKEVDYRRLGEVTRQLVRNLNRVIDRTSGILPNEGQRLLEEHFRLHPEDMTNPVFKEMMKHLQRDPTYDGRMRNRAVGVGGMGLASMLALLGLEYGSKGAMDVATITRACIYWHALDESANLAEEEGVYPTFEGSPLSKGILAPDMWLDEAAYMDTYLEGIDIGNMKRHKHALVDPASFGVQHDWQYLRERVKNGVRNSLLTCQMPNVTTSSVFGVSASIEPFYEIMYASSNVNGTDKNIYDVFRQVLISRNLYKPVEMAQFLVKNKGRVDGMHMLFPEGRDRDACKEVEKLFMNSFSINKKKYILMVQKMGMYIDQATSLNIFYDKPSVEYITQLSQLAWLNGNKTEYYLRRLAAGDKITTSMSSDIDIKVKEEMTNTADSPACRKDNPDCRWCQ